MHSARVLRAWLLTNVLGSALGRGGLCVAIVMFAIGLVPLFGGPGYEHAIASGLLVPTAAAIVAALRARPRICSPLTLVLDGVRTGALYAGIALLTAWLHLLRVPRCEPLAGSLYFALTAGAGCLLGGAWGSVIGLLLGPKRNRLVSIASAFVPAVLCVVISLVRFYSSPMIFAYDPFVGFFSGSLYDTVIEPGATLLTYRLGTVLTLSALGLLASALRYRERSIAWLAPPGPRRLRGLFGVLVLGASLVHCAYGQLMGHFHTKESIRAALGGHRSGARCDVVFPAGLRPDEAELLVRDCDDQLRRVEGELGFAGPSRVEAFFFRDPEDKRRLMGAAHTYIAKPWRHEVYLQVAPFPHPVLAHELAHVVAGSVGQGPFRVAGSAFGLLPNPGLIEGIAVAAAPDEDELSETEWARGMLELDLLPPVKPLFSLEFLGQSSSRSYTVAGAFVRYIMTTYGKLLVAQWYAGGNIEALTHRAWAELEQGFRASLHEVSFPPAALALAKARFARPSVFGRVCPHVIDRIRGEAEQCRDAGEWERARLRYATASALDTHDPGMKLALAQLDARHFDAEDGKRALRMLSEDTQISVAIRDKAEETLADGEGLGSRSEVASALAHYDALRARSFDEDTARSYEVKAMALRPYVALLNNSAATPTDLRIGAPIVGSEGTHDPVFGYLVGTSRERSPEPFTGAAKLGEAYQREANIPHVPGDQEPYLLAYLLGRNFLQRGFYQEASRYLTTAASSPTAFEKAPRVRRELFRLRAVLACVTRDEASVNALSAEIAQPNSPYEGTGAGRRASVVSLLTRCTVHPYDTITR